MFELDHVVYFTKKTPEEITKEVSIESLHPVIGGQHLQWGTHNALLYTRDSYIEYLAVEDESVARKSSQPLVQQLLYDLPGGEGFYTLCLRTDSIEKKNSYFRKLGYRTTGVIPAERKTQDGELLRWKMLFIEQRIGDDLPYPFFIQWEQPLAVRYQNLKATGMVQEENEDLIIERCLFNVRNTDQKITQWSRLLSLPVNGNTLKLPNTTFVFQASNEQKERLHNIELGKI